MHLFVFSVTLFLFVISNGTKDKLKAVRMNKVLGTVYIFCKSYAKFAKALNRGKISKLTQWNLYSSGWWGQRQDVGAKHLPSARTRPYYSTSYGRWPQGAMESLCSKPGKAPDALGHTRELCCASRNRYGRNSWPIRRHPPPMWCKSI